jgi:hypothetical protein
MTKKVAGEMEKFYRALFTACDRRNYGKIRDLVAEYLTHDEWVAAKHPDLEFSSEFADLMHRAETMIGM